MTELQLESFSKILFLGDFLYDYEYVRSDITNISSWIQKSCLSTILNLESPLIKTENPIKKRGPNLVQSRITIDILKQLNVVGVCLANNHIFDFGYSAFKGTIKILEENNIKYIGAGENLASASSPLLIRLNQGEDVLLSNYGWDVEETVVATKNKYGCNPRNDDWVVDCTRRFRRQYPKAYIVNIFHWGFEFNCYPMPFDISFSHKIIDSGCNLIIGHHSHCIQAKENYHDCMIYYSLGNFYFGSLREDFDIKDQDSNFICDTGLLLILNPMDFLLQEKFVEFNRSKGSSFIKDNHLFLPEITNVDFNSKSYYLKAKRNAFKVNPILSADNGTSKKQLARLKYQYSVAKHIQIIRRLPFGDFIYRWFKMLAKQLNQ